MTTAIGFCECCGKILEKTWGSNRRIYSILIDGKEHHIIFVWIVLKSV